MKIHFVIGFMLICIVNSIMVTRKLNFGAFRCPTEKKALGCCLKRNLNKYIPKLKTGFKNLNIPSIECLCLPCLCMRHTVGPCCFTAEYSCVQMKGFSRVKINDVKVNLKNREVTIRMCLPKLIMRGCYKLTYPNTDSQPEKTNGRFCAIYKGIDALMMFTIDRLHQRNDNDKLCTGFVHFDFIIEDIEMQVERLGGGMFMDDTMCQCFKDSWRNMAWKLKCPMEMAVSDYFLTLLNKVLANLNANCVLPDCNPIAFARPCVFVRNTTNVRSKLINNMNNVRGKPPPIKVTLINCTNNKPVDSERVFVDRHRYESIGTELGSVEISRFESIDLENPTFEPVDTELGNIVVPRFNPINTEFLNVERLRFEPIDNEDRNVDISRFQPVNTNFVNVHGPRFEHIDTELENFEISKVKNMKPEFLSVESSRFDPLDTELMKDESSFVPCPGPMYPNCTESSASVLSKSLLKNFY